MKQIGRKLFYNKVTGEIIHDTGERQGYVHELRYEDYFPEYNPNNHGVLELAYGERVDEIQNMGSWKVDPLTKQLIIYSRLTISTDKTQIQSDGIDTTTIIVTTQDECTVMFKVNDGIGYNVQTINKIATFKLCTEIAGDYIVTASNELYGTNSVLVKGV